MTINKFKKEIKSYCENKGYTFNPKHLLTHNKRIVVRLSDRIEEVFFIKTKEK